MNMQDLDRRKRMNRLIFVANFRFGLIIKGHLNKLARATGSLHNDCQMSKSLYNYFQIAALMSTFLEIF